MKRKYRLRCHRSFGRNVLDAETFQIDRLAVLLDQHDRARQLPRCNLIVEKFGDAFEFVRRGGGDVGRLVGRGGVDGNRQRQGYSQKPPGVRSRVAMQYLSSQRRHFFDLSRGHADLPENLTNWQMISMSATLSPRGQSPQWLSSPTNLRWTMSPFFDNWFGPGAEFESSSRNRTWSGLTSHGQAGSTAGEHIGRMR